ncbi:MAG: preprotein translocase subunit Sec61beta [Candidatus Aenigmatarchaeota archaeon]|nr:preprotein translocase subunit Sec61beta [Candidatus Aenigmarchaeota archaeon]
MAEKQRIQAPYGMAGLVRYEETEESLIKLKPEHIVALAAALVVIEIVLFFFVK